MNELQVVNYDGVDAIDSREVASMMGREHKELLKTIRQNIEYFDGGEISPNDFFIESTYTDALNRNKPNFLITKIGCDFIANKMQGEKGALFTAAYVTAFERMRTGYATAPKTQSEMFLIQAKINLEHEQRMNRIEAKQTEQDEKLHGIAAAFTATPTTEAAWQEEANRRVNEMVETYHLNHQTFRKSLYEQLERTANVDLTRRQTRMKNRMKAEGRTYAQRQGVTKLFIIAQDPKLRAIFDGILREEQAKHICT